MVTSPSDPVDQASEVTVTPGNSAVENAVEVRNVCKNYGDVEALRDLSLDFPRGQLTSLLGPSGCGKTTLLKIIAGLLDANSGEVTVNGKPVDGPGPDRAFVFQDFALLPRATGQNPETQTPDRGRDHPPVCRSP